MISKVGAILANIGKHFSLHDLNAILYNNASDVYGEWAICDLPNLYAKQSRHMTTWPNKEKRLVQVELSSEIMKLCNSNES